MNRENYFIWILSRLIEDLKFQDKFFLQLHRITNTKTSRINFYLFSLNIAISWRIQCCITINLKWRKKIHWIVYLIYILRIFKIHTNETRLIFMLLLFEYRISLMSIHLIVHINLIFLPKLETLKTDFSKEKAIRLSSLNSFYEEINIVKKIIFVTIWANF